MGKEYENQDIPPIQAIINHNSDERAQSHSAPLLPFTFTHCELNELNGINEDARNFRN